MKRGLRIAFSFILAVFLLWLFFRKLEFRHVLDGMKEARPAWLALAVVMQLVHLTVRSLRWRLLLSPLKERIGFYNLFSTTAIGYLLSFVLFRVGEVVRPFMLGDREGISKSGALATCVLERLMDFLTVAFLFGVFMIVLFQPPAVPSGELDLEQVRTAGLWFGVVTVASFPLLYVMVHFRQRIFEFFDRSMGREALLPRILHGFLGGFDAMKGGRLFTFAWVQSFVVWLAITASIWASLEAFDLRVGFGDSLLMLALLTFGIAIPTPGAVGSYVYFGQLGLTEFFGIEANRAAATILVTHAFAIAPVILIGIVFLWRDGLSVRSLSKMGKETPG